MAEPPFPPPILWAVLWRYEGRNCILDYWEKEEADNLAIMLAERGRTDIQVAPVEVTLSTDDKLRIASLKERLASVTKGTEVPAEFLH